MRKLENTSDVLAYKYFQISLVLYKDIHGFPTAFVVQLVVEYPHVARYNFVL